VTTEPLEGADIRVIGGDPTPEELAAVTAVVTAALDVIAGERRRQAQASQSAWQRSQRPVRSPLRRGTWTTFGV
jgi:hypothetical protein